MAFVIKDRVKETTTTTGTGTVTLAGAVSGFQGFSAIGNANTCPYVILDANGTAWEVGIGTYTAAGTTLARTAVLASTNSNAAINLSAGTHTVFVGWSARESQVAYFDSRGFIEWNATQYVSRNAADVTKLDFVAGKAIVNGSLLEWSATTSAAHSLVAAGMAYAYVYNNAGTPAFEIVTTEPAYDSTLGYYKKTGDDTRRCVWSGYVWATSTPTYRIAPFLARANGRVAEVHYMSEYVDASNAFDRNDIILVNLSAQTASINPTSFTLAQVPTHADDWIVDARIDSGAAASDVILSLHPEDRNNAAHALTQWETYSVRDYLATATTSTFFGAANLPIKTARTCYYDASHVAGTWGIRIYNRGFRFQL